MPYILQTLPETRLVFVGKDQMQGRYVTQLHEKAGRLGVVDHVSFSGFRTDIERLLATIDVLAVPSRPSMPEGLPLAVLEGLAAGCVVVATPNSGIPEAIVENETGFLVEPADPPALAQAVVRAMTLPSTERARLQHNGLELVKEKFSIQRQVISLGGLYEELVR
jgi:glycosyltransferase involved in cell wall biosynthesis